MACSTRKTFIYTNKFDSSLKHLWDYRVDVHKYIQLYFLDNFLFDLFRPGIEISIYF